MNSKLFLTAAVLCHLVFLAGSQNAATTTEESASTETSTDNGGGGKSTTLLIYTLCCRPMQNAGPELGGPGLLARCEHSISRVAWCEEIDEDPIFLSN